MAAGNVEDIIRLAQAGNAAAQAPHQFLPLRDRGAQVRGSRREVAMMQVIGLDPAFDEGPHQGLEHAGFVIDAAKQHRLAHQRNAGIGQPRAGGAGLGCELARMVGMNGDPCRRTFNA